MTTLFDGGFYYRGRLTNEADAIDQLERASVVAVDMESVSLSNMTAIGIGFYVSPTEGYYFPLWPRSTEYTPLAMWKIADPEVRQIYHNGNGFDLNVLDLLTTEEGFDAPNDAKTYYDTSIAGQCSGMPGALQRIGQEWFGRTDLFSIADLFAEYGCSSMLGVPEDRVAEKCLNDCRTTFELYEYLERTLTPAQRDCYEVDRRLVPVLRRVERRGLRLRQGVLADFRDRLQRNLLRLRTECENEGFNPGSPQQVGYVLASRGNVLPIRTSKLTGKSTIATGEEVLETLDDPYAKMTLEYRHDQKLLGSYVEPWIDKERAYTHFRLDLATGRLASGKLHPGDEVRRNLQNVPPAMREVFGPDNGEWTWADHGQIELRCLAYIAKDKAMIAEYAKPDPDLHSMTMHAAQRLGLSTFTRANGKTFNFARVFGAGDRQLSAKTGVPLDQVPIVRAAMASQFPESEAWIRYMSTNHGDTVDDAWGRRMRLPEMREHANVNPRRFASHVANCAVNYPVQATAAGVVKRGMLLLDETGVDWRLQIHDEYLVDGPWEPPDELAHIHPEFDTPFETKHGLTWT